MYDGRVKVEGEHGMRSKFYVTGIAIIVAVLLSGCGGSKGKPNVFSAADLCIERVDDPKQKVCYGMDRQEAEKVLNYGYSGFMVDYDYGVRVLYREDIVSGMYLTMEDSKGIYQTSRGIKLDSTMDDVKQAYGSKHALSDSKWTVQYAFHAKDRSPLGEEEFIQERSDQEMQQILTITASSAMDPDGKMISYVLFGDEKIIKKGP